MRIGTLKHRLIRSILSMKSDLKQSELNIRYSYGSSKRPCVREEYSPLMENSIISDLAIQIHKLNDLLSISGINELFPDRGYVRRIQVHRHSLSQLLQLIRMARGKMEHSQYIMNKRNVHPNSKKCGIVDKIYLQLVYRYMLKSVKSVN